jgi:hypothetical protein
VAALPAGTLRPLQVIAGALFMGGVVLLLVGAAVGPLATEEVDPMAARTVALVAGGWALLSPLLAALLTRRHDEAGATPPSAEHERRRLLLRFGMLDSAVTLCAAALLIGPIRWPLYAALVPLLAMGASFPREH